MKYAPEKEILGLIFRPWKPMEITVRVRNRKRNYGQIMDGMPSF
jgi:hypothetical protein